MGELAGGQCEVEVYSAKIGTLEMGKANVLLISAACWGSKSPRAAEFRKKTALLCH